MYRPPGLKNPYEYIKKLEPTGKSWDIEKARYAAYEAGADAMLEGLKKGIKPTLKPGRIGDSFVGYAVFIPEEE